MQAGTDGSTDILYGAAASPDGGFFLAGTTAGAWSGSNLGGFDFAVAKINSNGNSVWTWQVRWPVLSWLRQPREDIEGLHVVAGTTNSGYRIVSLLLGAPLFRLMVLR